MIELVDAIGQLGGDLRFGLRPAIDQNAVERLERLLARSLAPVRLVSGVSWATNWARVPTRPGLAQSMIDQRSPSPFSIGVPVSATRVWRRDGAAADVSRARILDRLGLVDRDLAPAHGRQFVHVANGGSVCRDHDVDLADLLCSAAPFSRDGP